MTEQNATEMTAAEKAAQIAALYGPVSDASKYRVAIREIARKAGWKFSQIANETDRFERTVGEGDDAVTTVVDVHHSAKDYVVEAEKVEGDSHSWLTSEGRARKMFRVNGWLSGDDESFIRLDAKQVARFESGRGIAKIRRDFPVKEAPKAEAEGSEVEAS